MAFALTRLERIYAVMESTFGTAVAVTGSNACRFMRCVIDNSVADMQRPDKTGTRTDALSSAGRKGCRWEVDMSLAPNGTAGTKPDMDAFMQCTFGQAGTVVAATSVTYSLSDNIQSFDLYDYRQPSTIDQRVSIGSIVQSAEFNIGQDGAATCSFKGEGLWGLQSNQFGVADATQKGGLGAFAAEPASPVTNGGFIAGFIGSVSIAGNTIATLRTGKVTINTANAITRDTFNTYYGTTPQGGVRRVSTSFSLYEDDSSAFSAIVAASQARSTVNVTYTLGTVAGSICTITLSGVQLQTHTKGENLRFYADFPDSPARGTGNKDEITVAFT